MKQPKKQIIKKGLNALVWKEDDLYVAKAIEVEVASQGTSRKEAINNLKEALELFFEDEKLPQSKIFPLPSLKLEKFFPNIHYA